MAFFVFESQLDAIVCIIPSLETTREKVLEYEWILEQVDEPLNPAKVDAQFTLIYIFIPPERGKILEIKWRDKGCLRVCHNNKIDTTDRGRLIISTKFVLRLIIGRFIRSRFRADPLTLGKAE